MNGCVIKSEEEKLLIPSHSEIRCELISPFFISPFLAFYKSAGCLLCGVI